MKLLKTTILNGSAVIVKVIAMLGINKVLAIYVGPTGYALVGQLQNAVQFFSVIASGGISSGITAYTAKYEGQDKQLQAWRAAFAFSLVTSVLCSVLVFYFKVFLADYFFGNKSLSFVFFVFSFSMVPFVFNVFFLSVLNGKKDISSYVCANIFASIFSFVSTAVLAFLYGLNGALISLVVYQALGFVFTYIFCIKKNWFRFECFVGVVEVESLKGLLGYAGMGLSSAFFGPLIYVFARGYITENFGSQYAGYWEANWRLSSAYLLLVTTTLSVYFIPRFSELSSKEEVFRELLSGYKLLIPVFIFGAFFVFLFRVQLMSFVFSSEFVEAADFLHWQLIGDFFKVISIVLSFFVLGRGMSLVFIFSEIFFAIVFGGLILVCCNYYGIHGIGLAYVLSYMLFFGYFVVFGWLKVKWK